MSGTGTTVEEATETGSATEEATDTGSATEEETEVSTAQGDTASETADSATEVVLDCDDQLACTKDSQSGDACVHDVEPGYCVIAKKCIKEGETAPDNPCMICDPATDTEQWSPATPGTSCGDCLVCDDQAACTQQDPACCTLADLTDDSTVHLGAAPCAEKVRQVQPVPAGCTAVVDVAFSQENSRTASSYHVQCNGGTWQNATGGAAVAASSWETVNTMMDRDWQAAVTYEAGCGAREAVVISCADEAKCDLNEAPVALYDAYCSGVPGWWDNPLVGEGTVLGRTSCEPGATQCATVTVTCGATGAWVEKRETTEAASASNGLSYVDTWFVEVAGERYTISTDTCSTRHCQGILIDKHWVFGWCDAYWASVVPGQRLSIGHTKYTNSSKTSSSDGRMECNGDGTWTQVTGGGGMRTSCPNCAWEWETNWDVDDDVVAKVACEDACAVSLASNYKYTFQSQTVYTSTGDIPAHHGLTRCVYKNGVLTDSSHAYCGGNGPNDWKDFGSDSTCPPTTTDLAAMALADSSISPCSSDNCVFWKTDWGFKTSTKDL